MGTAEWVALLSPSVLVIVTIIGGLLKFNSSIIQLDGKIDSKVNTIVANVGHLCRSQKEMHTDIKGLTSIVNTHLSDPHPHSSRLREIELRIEQVEKKV